MRSFKLSLVMLMVGVVCAAGLGAAQAATPCPKSGCKIYLPTITYTAQITLLSPSDGEHTISLAPVLSWKAPFVGSFHIQASEYSAFAPTSEFPLSETKELTLPLPAHVNTLISTNLKPKTIYYWRVQETNSKGERFVALGHFTTPSENKNLLPPDVPLLAPATHTTLTAPTALLQWQAVPNALYYRIRLFDASETLVQSAEVAGTETTLTTINLASGKTYHWRVKALNAYGWGGFAPDFFFTTP